MNIIWKRPDGTIAITYLMTDSIDPHEHAAELLARGDIPADYEKAGVDVPVPPKDEFRNALTFRNGAVEYDMARAAELHRDWLRTQRAPLLAALDVEYQRADEVGDAKAKADVVKRKQVLRDITKDPRLDAAKTIDDLRAVKCP